MVVCGHGRGLYRAGNRQRRSSESRRDGWRRHFDRGLEPAQPLCSCSDLGAMAGAALVWLTYLSHWEKTPEPLDKLGCFSTIPAIRAPLANILTEVIGTFVLVLVAAAISSKYGTGVGLSPGLGPFLIGFLVWGIGLSLGGPTSFAINPARDFGPPDIAPFPPLPRNGTSALSFTLYPVSLPP